METILMAAIQTGDGHVSVALRPRRHCDIIRHLARDGFDIPVKGEQGFLTSTGRFVNRVEAKAIAIASGQLVKSTTSELLYTEDLW